MLWPHESKNPSHCLTPPQLKNKLYRMKHALWWHLDLGWVQLRVSNVRPRFTAHYDLPHDIAQRDPAVEFLQDCIHIIMFCRKTFNCCFCNFNLNSLRCNIHSLCKNLITWSFSCDAFFTEINSFIFPSKTVWWLTVLSKKWPFIGKMWPKELIKNLGKHKDSLGKSNPSNKDINTQ